MDKNRTPFFFLGIAFVLVLAGCEIPGAGTPDYEATAIAATILALRSVGAPSPTRLPLSASSTATRTIHTTVAPLQTPIPQNPIVIQDALCLLGPGDPYEVVSSIKSGTRLELLGKGSLAGWWIVRNPLYHSPCWIADKYLQVDPNTNISGLQIFYPPPTPIDTPLSSATP